MQAVDYKTILCDYCLNPINCHSCSNNFLNIKLIRENIETDLMLNNPDLFKHYPSFYFKHKLNSIEDQFKLTQKLISFIYKKKVNELLISFIEQGLINPDEAKALEHKLIIDWLNH